MPQNDRRILEDFLGHWRIDRTINHGDGTTATFAGQAICAPTEFGLDFAEEGELSLPGCPVVRASRSYRWDGDLGVWFDDGRFFHRIPAVGGTAEHWCDPDHYVVVYDFARWPVWRTTWQVAGPRKDYRMVSTYAPSADGAR